jgi:hypothetical protein
MRPDSERDRTFALLLYYGYSTNKRNHANRFADELNLNCTIAFATLLEREFGGFVPYRRRSAKTRADFLGHRYSTDICRMQPGQTLLLKRRRQKSQAAL